MQFLILEDQGMYAELIVNIKWIMNIVVQEDKIH